MGSTDTDFLPAEREGQDTISRQADVVSKLDPFKIAEHIPLSFAVVNDKRQIVGCNGAFGKITLLNDPKDALGMRPGEALGCVHAEVHAGGCGTSAFCRYCGAARAILLALGDEDHSVEECRLSRQGESGIESMDLQVFCSSLDWDDSPYVAITAVDISHEKRRHSLERFFYHDVVNAASGMQMLASLMRDGQLSDPAEISRMLSDSAQSLLAKVFALKDLAAAEEGRLSVVLRKANTLGILTEAKMAVLETAKTFNKGIVLAGAAKDTDLLSDPKLVARVYARLVENAVEAGDDGGEVVLSCSVGKEVVFSVWNEGTLSKEVQRQLFKRSFSTKGTGRGLGLYATKLIVEEYLGGEVGYTSSSEGGTEFFIRLPHELKIEKRTGLVEH